MFLFFLKKKRVMLRLALLLYCILYSNQSQAQINNYKIGVGIYDITGLIAQSNFFGYAQLLHRNNGIRDRQYARAFIIQEGNNPPTVFVVIDKGGTFQSVNTAVINKLSETYGDLYSDKNVIISATHTHVASGGLSHFGLYNTATGGYWRDNFTNAVDGIYNAIRRAHNNLKPGRIYYNKGKLTNASINRSLVAYEQNEDANNFPSIDDDMTVLKFVQGNQEVGMISWFAVHPTSLSNSYTHNSSDNKGFASLAFERLKSSSYDEEGAFVAAFANSNAGDMSPNLNLPPLDNTSDDATGPGANEEESTDIIGQRQFDAALDLYNNATEQLTGSVKIVSRYADFSNLEIAPKFTDGSTESTCKAALGLSFQAGAEDGRSGISREGITKNPNSGQQIDRCHSEKPIAPFFFTGSNDDNPSTPKILSTSILKIGQLGILAAPAEFTVMAGRRAQSTVLSVLDTGISKTVFAGYSDAYAGYVTTREEYASQQYEGASTHFGPWTLAAYRQEFERLAQKLANPQSNPWPFAEPKVPRKDPPMNVTAPILYDRSPSGGNFGDVFDDVESTYFKGETASVTFWGAHPNNNLKINDTYLTVEQLIDDEWIPVYVDRDPITKLTWFRVGVSRSRILISWNIPDNTATGFYRIRHFGTWRNIIGRTRDYTGTSRTFFVE